MNVDDLLNLSPSDFNMILEGLEALKSKDIAGELMGTMFDSLLSKNTKDMSEEELERHNQRQLEKERKKHIKEEQQKRFKHEVDILKAKVTLLVELNNQREPVGLLNKK